MNDLINTCTECGSIIDNNDDSLCKSCWEEYKKRNNEKPGDDEEEICPEYEELENECIC